MAGRVRWKMLSLMLAGTIVIYVDRNTLGALAPILKKELNFTNEQYSYVVSAFQLVYSFAQPVAGFLTDLVGPRLGYAVAAVIWGGAAALHGLATGWISMAGFRAALGLSEAVAIPTGTKVSTLWFPTRERSIATGWFNSGSSIGAAITPPLVIWLAATTSWRLAFIVTGLLGLIVAAVWYAYYRDPEAYRGLSDEERAHILQDSPPEPPVRPSWGKVLRQPRFAGILIARFLTEPAWQTFQFWIPLYMVTARHMDIKQYALFAWAPFLASDLGCVLGGYLAPWLAVRFGLQIVNARLAVITIGACCMVGPALVSLAASPFAAILCFSLGGFAHQMLSSMMYALMGDVFEKPEVATATGVAGMLGYLGGALFTLAVGRLADTLGYDPLFAMLFLFDIVAAAALWIFVGVRHRVQTSLAPS